MAAPPAFVVWGSGGAFVLGLSADEQTPLPTEMRARLSADRVIRSINRQDDEDLGAVLRELGLRELSIAGWLRTPKVADAAALLATYGTKLEACASSGDVPNLLVLDGGRQTRSYPGRWGPAGAQTGNFVVRRPQTFGADLWGFAELADGSPKRLLDLPLAGDRWRGCDAAWRIQMAIDALAGDPRSIGSSSATAARGSTSSRRHDAALVRLSRPAAEWRRRQVFRERQGRCGQFRKSLQAVVAMSKT